MADLIVLKDETTDLERQLQASLDMVAQYQRLIGQYQYKNPFGVQPSTDMISSSNTNTYTWSAGYDNTATFTLSGAQNISGNYYTTQEGQLQLNSFPPFKL